MRSVADALRQHTRDRAAQQSPAERLAVALELGERDLQVLMTTRGWTRAAARQALRTSRSQGRTPSVAGVYP